MPREPLAIGTFGSISTKKKAGKWTATTRFRDEDGRTRQVSSRGESKAACIRSLKVKIAGRTLVTEGDITGETHVETLCTMYLEARAMQVEAGKITPNTRDKEERAINNHIVPALGGLRLREVTVRKLNAFLQSLAVDAPSLARNSRIILNGIFQIAATDLPGFINPVRETIHIKKSKPHPKALTAADVALIRQAISDWQSSQSSGPKRGKDLPDVLSVALGSGLRIGEILALLWSDVDLVGDPPTITVTGTLSQATGKGVYRRDCPKSEDSRRVVPIPQWLVSVLLERRLAMSKPGELVFSTRNGTVLSPTNVRRSLRAALKAADLPERLKDVHPHLFRSTVATAIKRESSMKDAAAVLGHSSPEITRTYYVEKENIAPDMRQVLARFAPEKSAKN
ncbi:site-specific integrase [Mobiluncus mulieris]|uniref:Site-specific integrase n=1 Tax=Mobiluncus mulieris TaxID=2052 RepID=A0A848RQ78_9ACTO|nr:site-specific integrase [Mobiluncus mulieris]MCU9996245.1 site-specific integrase [Mobiluncus mulieris]MCV0012915.1 site-specific integrase [Mobiluncus mulieris]NMW92364.1 site-specific integrase [Mobiluncus mulieris]